jgi:hypothetical protein
VGGDSGSLLAAAFAAERLLFDRGVLAIVVDGTARTSASDAPSLAAFVACVDAGAVVLYVGSLEPDSLGDKLVRDRVVRLDIDVTDPERAASDVLSAVEARGLFLT